MGHAQPVAGKHAAPSGALGGAVLVQGPPRLHRLFVAPERQRQQAAGIGQALEALDRDEAVDARDRLRLLDARFDELVARAVEVSVGSGDTNLLGNDVDELVGELEALRIALDETDQAESGSLAPPQPQSGSTSSPTPRSSP